MKITYVSPIDLTAESGAVKHVLGISRGLAALGHDLQLVAHASAAPPSLEGLNVHVIPSRGLSHWEVARRVTAEARHRCGGADLVYMRTFPLAYWLLTRHLAARRIPYVCELNTMTDTEYAARGRAWRGRIYAAFEARALAGAVGWLPVTHEIGAWARRLSGVERPLALARNGIGLEGLSTGKPREAVRRELGVSPQSKVLAMAGFTRPWHGLDRALALLAELGPETQLWLIGAKTEQERAGAEAMARSHGVEDAVRVFPWLTAAETGDLLSAADLGVASLALERAGLAEGQVLKVAHYLALGLPVLLNYEDVRIEATLPFVQQSLTTDPAVLAGVARRFLEGPPPDRQAIRDYAQAHLSWDAAARETEAFLSRVLAGPAALREVA